MKIGITLSTLRPDQFVDATLAAEALGYESVWMAEHLIWPADIQAAVRGSHMEGKVPRHLPLFDSIAVLSSLATLTNRVLLGTNIFLLALRHPFVGARAFATLDYLSGGRAIAGVGAGWLEPEWTACGLPFHSRGEMLDEAIEICKRLWREDTTSHQGRHYQFESVVFHPKPVQPRGVPFVIGGESRAARRRAAFLGDGWMSMFPQTPQSIQGPLSELRELEEAAGRPPAPLRSRY